MTPPWNGLSTGGTERLECETDALRNVIGTFMGQSQWVIESDAKVPNWSPGLSDITVEIIARHRTASSDSGLSDSAFISGAGRSLLANTSEGRNGVGIRWTPGPIGSYFVDWRWKANPQDIPGTIVIDGYTWTTPETFTHHACTYDRDGVMTSYLRGVVDSFTPSIAADSGVNAQGWGIYPLVGGNTDPSDFDDINDVLSGAVLNPVIFGAMAIHSRLLTPGELLANATALEVGDYPETQVLYIADELRGGYEQETDQDNISLSLKWALPAGFSNIFSPEAADGSVFLEDRSGNNRHFFFNTAESYNDVTEFQRARTAFSTEPY